MFRCASLLSALGLALVACGAPDLDEPTSHFRALRVSPQSFVIVAQVEAYYAQGDGQTTWRNAGDGRYALDISDRDPLTNAPRTINILFEVAPASRTFPEALAPIVDLAVNGERVSLAEANNLAAMIAQEINAAPRSFFPATAPRDHQSAETPLLCFTPDQASDFGPFTLADLDAAFAQSEGWARYERPGGMLTDGATYSYVGYAADDMTHERTEFAIASDGRTTTVLARQDFEGASAPTWWQGLAQCADLSRFIRTAGGMPERVPHDIAVEGVAKGMTYAAARDAMIAAGFNPIRVPHQHRQCNELQHRSCFDYPELMRCSGVGLNACQAVFQHSDRRLVILWTTGEWRQDFGRETAVDRVTAADIELAARLSP